MLSRFFDFEPFYTSYGPYDMEFEIFSAVNFDFYQSITLNDFYFEPWPNLLCTNPSTSDLSCSGVALSGIEIDSEFIIG